MVSFRHPYKCNQFGFLQDLPGFENAIKRA